MTCNEINLGDRGDDGSVSGYGYNGEMCDAGMGMLHLRARQYEPAMGRFSQKDVVRGTIERPASLSRYTYVGNDPVGYADPSGMFWKTIAVAAGTALVKAAGSIMVGSVATGSSLGQSAKNYVMNTVNKAVNTVNKAVSSVGSFVNEVAGTYYDAYESSGSYYYDSNGSSSGWSYEAEEARRQEAARIATQNYFANQANGAKAEAEARLKAVNADGANLSYAERRIYEDALSAIKNLNPQKPEDALKISQILSAACQKADKSSAQREVWDKLENAYLINDKNALPSDAELRSLGLDPAAIRQGLSGPAKEYHELFKDLTIQVQVEEHEAFVSYLSNADKEIFKTLKDYEWSLLYNHTDFEMDRMQMFDYLKIMRENMEREQIGGLVVETPARTTVEMLVALGMITEEEARDKRFEVLAFNLGTAYRSTMFDGAAFPGYVSRPGELSTSEAWDYFYLQSIMNKLFPQEVDQNSTDYLGRPSDPIVGKTGGLDWRLDQIEKYGFAYLSQSVSAGVGTTGYGQVIGSLEKLTADERTMIEDLVSQGKTVRVVPRSNELGERTPDFEVDGTLTELKTLNGKSLNTPVTRITDGFAQNAETVIIDARKTEMTLEQATQVIMRVNGLYPQGVPGKIEIWIESGTIYGGK